METRNPRAFSFAGAFSLSMLVLCGGAMLPGAMAELGVAQAAEASWKEKWNETLAAAKKEGGINVAGPPQAAERAVIDTFRKAFPEITVRYTGLSSGKFVSRVAVERSSGTYNWDVMVGGPTSFFDFIQKDYFQPIKPLMILPEVVDDKKWGGGFNAGFQDTAGKYVYAFTSYISNQIKVNRSVIPEAELADLDQVFDPKWAGKIVFYDPRGGGAGSTTLAMIRKMYGDEKVKTLLVDQKPVFSTDKRQFTEWVIRGRYPIGFGVVDAYLAPFHKQGVGKDVKTLRSKAEVLTTGSGTFVVMQNNPNPNATKVFVNWLLTPPVQALWAKSAVTNSRRLDVPSGSEDTRPDPDRLDSYINFNRQENYHMKDEAQTLARQLRP